MASQTTYTILIVDDEKSIRDALMRSLAKENYRVLTADCPAQAFEILRQSQVDLVISDHIMPDMTGLEFIKRIRVMYPGIVRVMLTGHADIDTVISAINQGEIYRLLTKPWDTFEIKMLLANAFEKLALERENRLLLATVKKQSGVLKKIEKENPGITHLEHDASGALVIDDVDMAELKDLLKRMDKEPAPYGS